jgi:hypothetical protein
MKSLILMVLPLVAGLVGVIGCVTQTYRPGSADNPFNRLKLGQTYGDMVRVLGDPDRSQAEDRTGKEAALGQVPVWGLVEAVGDMNPSAVQIYTYDKWGTIAVGNNKIIRIEGK